MVDELDAAQFRIDPTNLCIWRSGPSGVNERLRLTPKTFDVLRHLMEHAGQLVTHDELLRVVWRDVHVQPEVLKGHILAIRTALGEKADGSNFIQTERGRGYRFTGLIDGSSSRVDPVRARAELGVFAGRAEPTRELLAAMRQAGAGEPQAVFISGEPGIGKTALVGQFLARVARHSSLLVAQGQCIESFAGAEPYYPVLEALGTLCKRSAAVEALVTIAPTWAAQMPGQISREQRANLPRHAPEGARSSMIREACNLLETLAAEQPLVLVLEDLHWADYATIDLLSALCRRRSTARLLLIVTYRLEELTATRHPLRQMTRDLAVRNLCREISLDPLSEPEIAEVLRGGSDAGRIPDEFIWRLKERCGGNPLYMRITLENLAEHRLIERVRHGWRLLVPVGQLKFDTAPNLSRLIEARIDAMDDDQRCLLEVASVAGFRFDAASAASAAAMDEQAFEALCDNLARRGAFIGKDDLLSHPNHERVRTYVFNHAVLQQVVYRQIGETRRTAIHRAIGQRLEDLYPADQRGPISMQLAQQFSSGQDWPRALLYLRSALSIAMSRFARRDALAILDRAAEMTANLPERTRIQAELEFLERRGAILAAGHDSRTPEVLWELSSKAREHGDIDLLIRALLGLAYALSWHDLGQSSRILDEVLVISDSLDDPIKQDTTRITAYSRRIWALGWNRRDARRCEEAFIRLRNHGDRLTIARAQISFSMICILSARYRQSHELVSDGFRLLQAGSESIVETDLARAAWMLHVGVPWALFFQGEFGAAFNTIESSISAYLKNGDTSAAQSLSIYRSVLLFHALAFEDVLGACEPVALEIVSAPSNSGASDVSVLPLEQRISLIFSGLARVALGHSKPALQYLRVAEAQMEKQPVQLDWYWRLALEWGFVDCHIAAGEYMAARDRADCLTEQSLQTDERAWQALAWESQARVALHTGETSRAMGFVVKALAACEGTPVPLGEWRVHATAAVAYKAANDHFKAATHAGLSMAARTRLAETLQKEHPVRHVFEDRSRRYAV